MNEREYAEIAAACDRLLRAPDTTAGRVAVPMLHVIDEHPSHLAQYGPLVDSASPRFVVPARRSTRLAMRAGRALARLLRFPAIPWNQFRKAGRIDVLIVSRQRGPALPREDDLYFGPMQRMLAERGAATVVVRVEQLAHAIAPREEARIWRQCIAVCAGLRREAQSAPNELDGAVAKLASRHALSGISAANLRLHANLSALCRLLQPRVVITTIEGVATERLIWHAARSDDARPLCVGYQHTRILKRAHAIRRSLRAPGIDCDPDLILTSGEIPHEALAASPDLAGIQLIRYGSHRRALPTALPSFSERPRRCIVLPDGDERECLLLFEFALACARRCPDLTFVLRPHPLIVLGALRQRHDWLRDVAANVVFSSQRTLGEECAEARYCLYRGSSAVIQAVLGGVKPFYVALSGELSFDPLFDLPDWRETITSVEEFSGRANAAEMAIDPNAELRARTYCER